MCFYGQELYRCGDWTWGRFSIRCTYQHRVGETCGLKLVGHTEVIQDLCTLCIKIATKCRRREFELQRLRQWYGGGGRLKASIEKSEATVRQLEEVILGLERRRPLKGKSARPHKPPKAILPSHWGIVLPGDWAKSMHRGQLRGFGYNPNAMVNERPMKIALQGLHGTKDPNYSTIARKHQINRITMWRRHLGLAVSKAEATSRFHKKLTAAQEKQLLRQLEDLSDRGLATTSVLPSSSTN
ncbi:hypothetical protein CIRG_09944 [Coccidioides immitis RMSCC 2394]|uniref:Uncharacterized protein n=2 Tax=Coccidioides TaxID=5500 RepID=A0A0J6YTE4_COCIT|nr:hypothetical protein CIRG_09944 [Coccidioides immitis RMSCC 2394]